MIHCVYTKFHQILGGHLRTFVELIWNDPHLSLLVLVVFLSLFLLCQKNQQNTYM